jgi:hypothetical protein
MISISRVVANFGKGRRLNIVGPLLDAGLTDIEDPTVETLDGLMDVVGEEASGSCEVDVGE